MTKARGDAGCAAAKLRLWAAAEARALGRGGVTTVAKASGLSRTTIYAGLRELDAPPTEQAQGSPRIRARGGGRKRLIDKDTALLSDLDTLGSSRKIIYQ
jgi:hypothetical protein